MASAGSIFIDLLLKDTNYVQGLNKAKQNTRSFAGSAQSDLSKTGQAFNSVLSPVNNVSAAIGQLGGIVASALSVQKIIQYSDAFKGLEARLDLVTRSAAESAAVQQQLFDIAQNTAQPFNETISAFTRLSNSLSEYQKEQTDLIGLTDLLSKTLVISGTNAAGAATFFQQFGQAASSDFKAIGQELQTFADQNPVLYKILSDEARNYGKTLKQMGEDGELSFEFIANAVQKAGGQINEQADQISLTVGRAFQQLDNAFLRFVGTSEQVAQGTNTIALGVQFLAQNLDLVAGAATAVAAVFTARMIGALGKSASLFLLNAAEAARYNATLAAMAPFSARAAVSVTGLSLALNRAAGALALVGGPVGAAFLAVMAAITLNTTGAQKAQDLYDQSSRDLYKIQSDLTGASGTRAEALRKERDEILKNVLAEAKLADEKLRSLQQSKIPSLDPLALFGLSAKQGAERDLSDEVTKRYDDYRKLIDEINRVQSPVVADSPLSGGLDKEAESALKKRQKELEGLYTKNRDLIFSLDKATVDYMDTSRDLYELQEEGLISYEQLNVALNNLGAEYDKNSEKAEIWGVDIETFGKRAAENIQDAFADFLFDPFEQGLDGMLKGFVDTVRKMIAEAQAAKLAKGLFGELAGGEGGGFLGGLFGNLFGGGGSKGIANPNIVGSQYMFADGGYLPPGKFGIAGEAGAELLYGGNTGISVFNQDQIGSARKGGNTYNIDARGTDSSVIARLEQSILALAGPGQIEKRVFNAQRRGSL